MSTPLRFVFAGGGTAGHRMPLIAVAEAVRKQYPDSEVHYIGLAYDVNALQAQYQHLFTSCTVIEGGKLHRYLSAPHLRELAKVSRGFVQAKAALRALRPDVVFTKGGYVSVPVAFHAWRMGIPVAIHESDSVPGLSNQMLGVVASQIFTAFPLQASRVQWVGLPVRTAFRDKQSTCPDWIMPSLPILTCVGGSQGAARVNRLVSEAWPELLERWQLVHITGEAQHAALQEKAEALPEALRERLHLRTFVHEELPYLFQKSEVVISRAGSTIFELAAAKAATVLLPLSTASRNHQVANARALGSAVLMCDERTATSTDLVTLVTNAADSEVNKSLRTKLAEFDKPDAASVLASALGKLAS